MDLLPAGLLLASASSFPSVPTLLYRGSGEGVCGRRAGFFLSLGSLRERDAFQHYLAPVRKAEWVVYAKRPFAGPEQVLDYVGRYTHRVAISNNRILDVEDGKVRFRWKDYRHNNQQKTMTLSADEFIRRFLIHVLPSGFQHIRYYGFLGNRYREEKLAHCRELLGMAQPEPVHDEANKDYRHRHEEITGVSLFECPVCRLGRMTIFRAIRPLRTARRIRIRHDRTALRPPL